MTIGAIASEGEPTPSPTPKVLGEFIWTHEFPADQRARIATAASDETNVCGRVVRRFATQTKNYKNGFVKHERIPGARPGHHLYKAQSIQRIINYLGTPGHRWHQNVWGLYREAAMLYIEKELPALHDLLVQVDDLVADMPTALKVMCSWATEYGVTSEEILRFYEVWGSPRVDDFEARLPEWMKPDESAQQRRQIASLADGVSSIKESLEGTKTETLSLKQLVTEAVDRAAAEGRRTHGALDEAKRELLADISALSAKIGVLDTRATRLDEIARSSAGSSDIVRRESAALLAKVQRLESDVIEVSTMADATRATLESQLRDGLSSLKREIDAQIGEVSSRLSSFGQSRELATVSQSARPPHVRLGESLRWSSADQRLTTKKDLLRALATSLKARGIDPFVGMRLHAAISANVMPVLCGPLAVAALDAYADVVFGGRLVKVHVTPTLMEPADLFGAVDVERRMYRPHRSHLLDAVVAVQDLGSAMVVLEGINRGPTESYLVPLLTHRGPIQLFHESDVATDDIPAAIEWPRGLRLAATCVAGPTSLPVSRDLWANSVAIEVAPLAELAQGAVAQGRSEFAIDGGVLTEVDVSPDLLASLITTFPEARSCLSAMNRFARAFLSLNSNEPELRRALVEAALLPIISGIAMEDQRTSALEAIGRELGADANELRELELRLRRSIS